jgi:hypothetical protein
VKQLGRVLKQEALAAVQSILVTAPPIASIRVLSSRVRSVSLLRASFFVVFFIAGLLEAL